MIHPLIPDNQPESLGSAAGFGEGGGVSGGAVAAGLEGSSEAVGGGNSCGMGMVAGSNGFGAGASNPGDDARPVTDPPSRTFFWYTSTSSCRAAVFSCVTVSSY